MAEVLITICIVEFGEIERYGKYCGLFQCAKGPQDIGLVKRQSFSPQ